MTAATHEKMRSFERWTYRMFPLASGKKAWKHVAIGINLATGKVEPAAGGVALFIIGVANETVDATAAEKPLNVNLCKEIEVEWWASAGGIVATDIGKLVYFADDQTVTLTATGNSCAGRMWAFDSARGVAVEKLPAVPGTGGTE